jgi:cbb3-type cytochrome oxidase maturation protein
MSVMFVLIGFSLLVALTFLGLFVWAVRSGQFDDKFTPSVRMLFDDGKPVEDTSTSDLQVNRSTE